MILVTHALHFLSLCDYIYTVASGKIGEHGTYADLVARGGEFSRLAREFGGEDKREEENKDIGEEDEQSDSGPASVDKEKLKAKLDLSRVAGKGTLEGRLIVKEKRTTGSVSWKSESSKLPSQRCCFLTDIISL